jgi:hypothetical protein
MPLRFRRSVRVLPGIRLNIGKRGVSTTIGGRGAHITLRPGHSPRATVGVPGTGVSYTEGGQLRRPEPESVSDRPARPRTSVDAVIALIVLLAIAVAMWTVVLR